MVRAGRIAAIAGADSTLTQPILAAAVAAWRMSGVNVVGVIAEAHGIPGRTCGAGFLRDIVSGKPYPIYREAAPSNTSCHLDADGVEAACTNLRNQIAASDLVVLSKFGKLEAMHGGLAGAFAAALAAGKPLLTTVSDKHRDAWRALAPTAFDLAADAAALDARWRGADWKREPRSLLNAC